MNGNPYDAPSETVSPGTAPPGRVGFFGRAHLALAGAGFVLLLYSKATRKNGFSWTMTGDMRIAHDRVEGLLAGNGGWIVIQQFYRAFEGFLILNGALFVISGIALLCRARWSVAASNAACGVGLAGAAAFLGLAATAISPALAELCRALGTEPRRAVLLGFITGMVGMIAYAVLGLTLLNRAVTKAYLRFL